MWDGFANAVEKDRMLMQSAEDLRTRARGIERNALR